MKFSALVEQVSELLQRQQRISYRALKREFDLDDEDVEDLKAELIDAKRLASDEEGKVLVWSGEEPKAETENRGNGESEKGSLGSSVQRLESKDQSPTPNPQPLAPRSAAERRQLTVMFCDLVGSTALSAQLDPEELREVVQAYQETCTGVIRRYDGHIAQHLGDGLLVYFGYPAAHEDDAQRAVRAGLEIIVTLQKAVPSPFQENLPLTPSPFQGEGRGEGSAEAQSNSPHLLPLPKGARGLQVRIGIHTGLVVIGEIGSSEKREILALGETPNLAARLQSLAEPDTVVISAATQRLVQGLFACQDKGPQEMKGIPAPISMYQVLGESSTQSRFEAAVSIGLTPLVGREEELGLLRRRWEQAKAGEGQVVLLNGEPGIGKSRLVHALKEQIVTEGATRIEFRFSAYHQNSAFYPIIDHLQRLLQFQREDAPQTKLTKLQQALAQYRFPQADTLPLLAALLSLPHPDGFAPLTLSPQKQKQKTQEALTTWIVEEAKQAAVYCAWEDLHWADPSTLEVLTFLLDQVPTTRLLVVLTYRPEFTPPWGAHSYLSQLTLNRLGRGHVETMVEKVTGGRALPKEVVQQIVAKTDGVPLFVEELTKSVVESIGAHGRTPLQFAIPATLQDSLMARLDRLGAAKEVAQLGATLGREFSYEVLHAVSPLGEATLQQGLKQLVEAELVYQRGLAPQAHYLFKHALIQDTAYQLLLKSTRQQYHRQIAQVLERRFRGTVETQPELLAHHYTEAGLIEQAIPHWQQAGERATQRSAYVEAIAHLTKGLELLKTLPETPERVQQELTLQLALGDALAAVRGYTAPEVKKPVTRAWELCQHLRETPQLVPVLLRLWTFYFLRGELQTALELAEQMMRLAQSVQDPYLLSLAHFALGCTLYWLGELTSARTHLEQGIALCDPQKYPRRTVRVTRVNCLSFASWTLWGLGYPDQGLQKSHEAVAVAEGMSHPLSLAYALGCAASFHLGRREGQLARERAEAAIKLCIDQDFPYWLAYGTMMRGGALTLQGQGEEGIVQMQQGLAAYRAIGAELGMTWSPAILAEAHGKVGQVEGGLTVLAEALATADKTGARVSEAEMFRLKGELTLQQWKVESQKSKVKEAEEYFLKAIEIARKQQAKSPELRAVMSLSRLWQRQGKKEEARQMLAEIYNWFTEGFDTKDLQEAKVLLEGLSH